MDYQNITLSIRKDLLRRVKHIAIERQTSVSGLLARILEDLVQKEDSYNKAREHHIRILNDAPDLGTHGNITWGRGDLYER
ncbi:MAG: CopG family transcriptional regulator [Firmicutes bacterium]|nr:CopG family transcriptional regulator [Bacillota bacterium]